MPTGVYERLPRVLPDPLLRFWTFVNKTDVAGCWCWTGGLRKGYGRFWVNQKSVPAHRYIYIRTYGPLNDTLVVCHRCDNPVCVRPDHLFAGSVQDNTQDAINKGRFDPRQLSRAAPHYTGEQNGNHVLTDAQVVEIRTLYQPGTAPYRSLHSLNGLAHQFGVSKFTIQSIIKRVTWRHL